MRDLRESSLSHFRSSKRLRKRSLKYGCFRKHLDLRQSLWRKPLDKITVSLTADYVLKKGSSTLNCTNELLHYERIMRSGHIVSLLRFLNFRTQP